MAAASSALADLVAQADPSPITPSLSIEVEPDVAVTAGPVEPTTVPVEADQADPGAAERPVSESAEPPVGADSAEPAEAAGPEADADGDPAGDPVFAELVSAYGVDPVHDALTVPTGADPPDAGAVPDEPGASDRAPVGG